MSESNQAVIDEEERKEDSFFDLGDTEAPAAEAPTPETGVVPPIEGQGVPPAEGQEGAGTGETTPETPDAPAKGQSVPEWLSEIPETDRREILESWLQDLSANDRARLGPVSELLASARQSQDALTRQRTQEEIERQENERLVIEHAASLSERINQGIVQDADAELAAFEEVAGDVRQAQIGVGLSNVIVNAAAKIGIQSFPSDVVAQAEQAQDLTGAFAVYSNFVFAQAFEAGKNAGTNQAGKRSTADEVAYKARLRNEVLGDLAAGKKVAIAADGSVSLTPDRVPPAISGGDNVSVGALTDDDFNRLAAGKMSDQEYESKRELFQAAMKDVL